MSFDSLLIHTVGVRTRTTGTTDRYGNETLVYAAAVTTPARMEETKAEEILGDRDTRLTWFNIFLPPTVAISALDHVEWGSRTFEVDGEPTTYHDSVGAHHITALAKEIKG